MVKMEANYHAIRNIIIHVLVVNFQNVFIDIAQHNTCDIVWMWFSTSSNDPVSHIFRGNGPQLARETVALKWYCYTRRNDQTV